MLLRVYSVIHSPNLDDSKSKPVMENFNLFQTLQQLVNEILAGFETITSERQKKLNSLAQLISNRLQQNNKADLTFICTHNSRRSHLSQVLSQTAAFYYGIESVTCFSGGTEATACNPRTVRAFRRAGFSVVDSTGGDNPRYLLQFAEPARPIELWSKVYDQEGNPTENFIAVMTCSHADENCPLAPGAADRFSLNFEDPKSSDDTPQEEAVYDQRLREIGAEMFYLMSLVSDSIN